MIWLALALVIVLVVAVLLIWVLLEARGIKTQALRALKAAGDVERGTVALWAILDVNNLLIAANSLVGSIAGKANAAANAVAPEKR